MKFKRMVILLSILYMLYINPYWLPVGRKNFGGICYNKTLLWAVSLKYHF